MQARHWRIVFIGCSLMLLVGGWMRSAAARPRPTTALFLPIILGETTPQPTPTPPAVATPVATATIPPQPITDEGPVAITAIFYDGIVPSRESDEYVEIKNVSAQSFQLHQWELSDSDGMRFFFPPFELLPNQVCRVYTNEVHAEWCGFSFGSGRAIWLNSGPDEATLRDASGTIVDQCAYQGGDTIKLC